jgi:hypothetical protein
MLLSATGRRAAPEKTLFVDDDLVLRKLFKRSLTAAPTWKIKKHERGSSTEDGGLGNMI